MEDNLEHYMDQKIATEIMLRMMNKTLEDYGITKDIEDMRHEEHAMILFNFIETHGTETYCQILEGEIK